MGTPSHLPKDTYTAVGAAPQANFAAAYEILLACVEEWEPSRAPRPHPPADDRAFVSPYVGPSGYSKPLRLARSGCPGVADFSSGGRSSVYARPENVAFLDVRLSEQQRSARPCVGRFPFSRASLSSTRGFLKIGVGPESLAPCFSRNWPRQCLRRHTPLLMTLSTLRLTLDGSPASSVAANLSGSLQRPVQRPPRWQRAVGRGFTRCGAAFMRRVWRRRLRVAARACPGVIAQAFPIRAMNTHAMASLLRVSRALVLVGRRAALEGQQILRAGFQGLHELVAERGQQIAEMICPLRWRCLRHRPCPVHPRRALPPLRGIGCHQQRGKGPPRALPPNYFGHIRGRAARHQGQRPLRPHLPPRSRGGVARPGDVPWAAVRLHGLAVVVAGGRGRQPHVHRPLRWFAQRLPYLEHRDAIITFPVTRYDAPHDIPMTPQQRQAATTCCAPRRSTHIARRSRNYELPICFTEGCGPVDMLFTRAVVLHSTRGERPAVPPARAPECRARRDLCQDSRGPGGRCCAAHLLGFAGRPPARVVQNHSGHPLNVG